MTPDPGQTTPRQAMGPLVKGWSPSFTETGKSAYWPFPSEGYPGVQPVHNGIFLQYDADGDALARLLPAPLTPTHDTGRITLFINQTILLPNGLDDLTNVEPDATRFNEALLT